MASGKHRVGRSGPRSVAGVNRTPQGLASDIMDEQQKYRPNVQLPARTVDGVDVGQPLPYGGQAPSEAKARAQLKSAMMRDPDLYGLETNPTLGHTANWTVGDSDVAIAREREKELEQASFLEYVSKIVDVRQPGKLAWLNDLVPEFAEGQMQQLDTNLELIKRAMQIQNFGIQSREDLLFQYLIDSGKIRDSREYATNMYIPGFLNPTGWTTTFPGFAGLGSRGPPPNAQNRGQVPWAPFPYMADNTSQYAMPGVGATFWAPP